MLSVPQYIGLGTGALVNRGAGIDPGVGRQVEAVDAVFRCGRIPEITPPALIIEPELALRFFAGRGGDDAVAVVEVAEAGGQGVRLGVKRSPNHRNGDEQAVN